MKFIDEGKELPEELIQQIKKRKSSQEELKKVKEALKIIQRSKGRRRDKSRRGPQVNPGMGKEWLNSRKRS